MSTITLLSFFGGIMLILYGMRLAGDGLQKASGARLRSFLLTATNNRIKGVTVGAVITALIQSSSATTVMLVGFVGAGLLGLRETMGIILGADIGTTITVQIITFRVYDYALAVIGLGVIIIFLGRKSVGKEIGQAILGFGFIFFALKILVDTFTPVTQNPLLKGAMLGLGKDPVAGIIVSAVITALLQSSAATLGLAVSAAHSGLLSLDAAMPIVLGANIGTCLSAIISSMGATVAAKRVAFAHILFKIIGVIIVLPFLGVFTRFVGLSSPDLARQVANAHTLFNIAITIIFLPFIGPFTRLVTFILPEKKGAERFGPKYLDPIVLSSPPLALVQASRESLRIADIVQDMLVKSLDVFEKNDMDLLEKIEERDDEVDILDKDIKLYLTKLVRESLSEEQAKTELEIILFSDSMENVGDVIDKNLMDMARKKIKGGLSFSKEGMSEIRMLHQKVVENLELGIAAFAGSNADLAQKLINHKAKISEMERDLRQAHITRLHKGLKESIDTSSIHLDVLANLKRINSLITNIAYPIVESKKS